jgi:hypothetical protein
VLRTVAKSAEPPLAYLFRVDFVCNRSESRQRAQCVSMAFSLHALAAQKMPQLQIHLRRHAAEKPAIHARCSKTNPSNSQTADKVCFRCSYTKVCF